MYIGKINKLSLKIHVPYTDLTYKETARATLKLRANPYPGDGPGRSSVPPRVVR